MSETEINYLKTLLANFRKKDQKKIARYLYKSVRQLRKEVRRKRW